MEKRKTLQYRESSQCLPGRSSLLCRLSLWGLWRNQKVDGPTSKQKSLFLSIFVGFEILTAVFMNVAIFWDIANFDSEDGGDIFLRSVASHTALFPEDGGHFSTYC
jgi:hypothetical protein